MAKQDIVWCDLFIAGVPPRPIFRIDLEELDRIVANSVDEQEFRGRKTSRTAAVCLIGLASYFEAFCKNQFAAIINICPQVLNRFTSRRTNVTLNLKDILKISNAIDYRIGSLLSEEYDFGSARTVNSLFNDLLGITPFSSAEAKKYSQFLDDRNLLVHHGGVYTFKYHSQRLANRPPEGLAHWESLIVGKAEFKKWAKFLQSIADKITTGSHKALGQFVQSEKIILHQENKDALEYILWE